MSDDGTNQRPAGVKQDDRVLEFARQALGGRRVSKEAWIAACQVAEAAIRVAQRVVPVEEIELSFTRALTLANLKLVHRDKYVEILAALDAFGMKSYQTDSRALMRVKRAYEMLKWEDVRPRVPEAFVRNGLPMPDEDK